MLKQSIEAYIKAHEQEALALLKTLAQIPAPSGHEEARAQFCRDWLLSQGAEHVYIDDALNVIYLAESPAPDATEEKQVISGMKKSACTSLLEVYAAHTDVVFPDTETLPLSEQNGRLYCPGIGDDTACLAALLLAAKFIAAHIHTPEWETLRPKASPGLLLVFNSCEEGLGNLKGIKEICRVFEDRIHSFVSFDSELSAVVNQAVGSMRYRITIRTEGGHSFSDFGKPNAIERLSRLIEALYRIKVPTEGHTTYNVGSISGGTSVNTIAQEASMLYEFRSDKHQYLQYMEEKMTECIEKERRPGVAISVELLGVRPCAGDVDAAAQRKLEQKALWTVKNVTGKPPVFRAGSTDCNLPLSLGIPSVCAGCYRGKGAHTREEYIELSSLKQGYRIVFEMIFGS